VQILFTSETTHPPTTFYKNYKNSLLKSKTQKEYQLICLQVENSSYVTLLLWRDTELVCLDLGSNISECDLFLPRCHETCFSRFTTQEAFDFFQLKIRCTSSEFQRPKSPAKSQGVSQRANRDLHYKTNSRSLPWLTSYNRRIGIRVYQELTLSC
jgi:hypothetical protein